MTNVFAVVSRAIDTVPLPPALANAPVPPVTTYFIFCGNGLPPVWVCPVRSMVTDPVAAVSVNSPVAGADLMNPGGVIVPLTVTAPSDRAVPVPVKT